MSAEHRTKTVVVVGAINVDLVVETSRLPAPGETVVGRRVQRFGGGKGANASVAASRAGAAVILIGAVGADEMGRAALDELASDGVDVRHVDVRQEEPTGVALIVVDERGENQIAVAAGANACLTAEHVTNVLRSCLDHVGCVLVSTEIPDAAVTAAVEAATAAHVTCVLNPAPVTDAVVESLSLGPIVTPNETELADLVARLATVGGGSTDDAARAVGSLTNQPVVVTMGGRGVCVMGADGVARQVPAPATPVRDTTGAGDTFNGVLAARLAAGDDLDRAVRLAVAAASLSVAFLGARAGMPSLDRILHAATSEP